ncbi:MAG: PASTA domain-containing protein, partial [Eubacterium sp.]|nr:PASTA domain-containing protein [Eubacterium sp.]
NLKGLSLSEAKEKLKDKGLKLDVEDEKDPDYSNVKKGKVSDQSIYAGDILNTIDAEGKELTLYTSRGKKPEPKKEATPRPTQKASSTQPRSASEPRIDAIKEPERKISALD